MVAAHSIATNITLGPTTFGLKIYSDVKKWSREILSQTTVNSLSVHYQHPFYRPHKLQSNDGRSTFYSHEYHTLNDHFWTQNIQR